MITEVNPHTDPIMQAWGSLEILLGIHRPNKHTKGSPKSYKKKILATFERFPCVEAEAPKLSPPDAKN